MVKNIRRRRRRKRKTVRRRRNASSTAVTVMNPYSVLGGFPDKVKVKLRYVEEIRLNPTVGNINQWVGRAISCFDPSFSTVGHQPHYFDQWSAIYSKYTVMGSKCIMQPTYATPNPQPNGFFGIYASTEQTGVNALGDIQTILESNHSSNMRIAGLGGLGGGSLPPSSQSKAVMNFSTRKFFGIKDPQDGGAYSGQTGNLLIGSNPAQEAYFACYYAPVSGNEPESMSFLITIDYLVEFRDRIPVVGS